VDIFLVESDYAVKYVNTEYTLPIADLGIKEYDIADQYRYTWDVVTDSEGVIKGLAWQACPGALFYNRQAAIDIFGTDDPAYIQNYVSTWDSFLDVADYAAWYGYDIVSSVFDTYRVYANNVSSPWVTDDYKINIDANILKWVEDSKYLVDMGYAGTHNLWGEEWNEGFYPEGRVFGYFGPAWLVNYCMADGVDGAIATNGGWGATEGPQGFYWGGTWICAATGTDNGDLIKDILLKLTADPDIMTGIVAKDDDFANNKPVMEAWATDYYYSSRILGGQNPLSVYSTNAARIDCSYSTPYDQDCNEAFQEAMKFYFDGAMTYEDALNIFYVEVLEKHPELSW